MKYQTAEQSARNIYRDSIGERIKVASVVNKSKVPELEALAKEEDPVRMLDKYRQWEVIEVIPKVSGQRPWWILRCRQGQLVVTELARGGWVCRGNPNEKLPRRPPGPKAKGERQKHTFRLTPDALKRAKQLAKQRGVDQGWLVSAAIMHFDENINLEITK